MKYCVTMLGLGGCLLLSACQTVKPQPFAPSHVKAATYNIELGLGYLNKGDMPRAKQKLLKALVQAPQSPTANDAMAYYLEVTGDTQQAAHYYRRAIAVAPGNGGPLNDYGTFWCRQGHYAVANHYFMQAVKDHSYVNSAAIYENAGLCALAAHDKVAAKRYLTIALAQDPHRDKAREQLVRLQ